jgi:hypothetical protein
MFELNDNEIYFINIPQNDKPIKLVIENNISNRTETYKMTLKEVLVEELRNLWSINTLTGQQYKSEKGKIKREYTEQVINFLIKRGITKEYINNEMNKERERLVFVQQFNINDFLTKTLGVICL